MELQSMELTSRNTPTSLLVPPQDGAAPRLVCRCDGCGGVVTFDALIVTCACADDEPRVDSTLH